MTGRERLIDKIKKSLFKHIYKSCNLSESIADDLLADSVIVPPCKVGDMVYILAGHNGHKYEQDTCEGFYIGDDGVVQVRVRNMKGNHGTYGVFGITVFLSKEEAEKALEAENEKQN